MSNVDYPQALALKALGMEQEAWPQLVWQNRNDNRRMWIDWWPLPPFGWPYLAAPHVSEAILWVLASAAWKDKHGGPFRVVVGSGGCTVESVEWPIANAATLSLLLDAMLKEVAQ